MTHEKFNDWNEEAPWSKFPNLRGIAQKEEGEGRGRKAWKRGKGKGSLPFSLQSPSLFTFLPISLSMPAEQAEIPMWVSRTLFMGRAKLDIWDVTDSNVDLSMYLIEELENSTIELGLISHFPHSWLTRVRLIDRVTK